MNHDDSHAHSVLLCVCDSFVPLIYFQLFVVLGLQQSHTHYELDVYNVHSYTVNDNTDAYMHIMNHA